MKNRLSPFWLTMVLCLVLTSCAGGGGSPQQGSSQPDYKTMKTMVLDILQTDDAKKSVSTMMKDEKFKQSMVMDDTAVRSTVIQSLSDPKNPHIQQLYSDPKFTSTLAKSMKDHNKQIMKDLMKDPDYQKSLMSIMKDPEFERGMLELMRSSTYRKITMEVMKESLQSPLYQNELLKIMTRAAEDMSVPRMQQQEKKKGGGKGGGGGGSGQGGGGGGGKT